MNYLITILAFLNIGFGTSFENSFYHRESGSFAVDSLGVTGQIRVVQGSETPCYGYTFCVEVEPVYGATEYEWPNTDSKILEDKNRACFVVNRVSNRMTITVTPRNDTTTGNTSQITLRTKQTRRINKFLPICDYHDLPITVADELIYSDTFFKKTYKDSINCDSIVNFWVTNKSTPKKDISAFLCNDFPFEFKDSTYLTKGVYSYRQKNSVGQFCDSVFTIRLDTISNNPIKEIEANYEGVLDAMTLKWRDNQNIEKYNIFLNNEFHISQKDTSFQYLFNKDRERFDFKIFPKAGARCDLEPIEKTYFKPTGKLFIIAVPNPSRGVFHVLPADGIEKIDVYNSFGTWLFETTKPMVDLEEYPSGSYFLKIEQAFGVSITRTIVKM